MTVTNKYMKKTFSELAFKRLLQSFIVFCCIGFPLEIMPNKILLSLITGIVLIYIVDIIYDIKTLNERLDNHILVLTEIIVGGIKYHLEFLEPSDYLKNKNLKTQGNCITKIFKVENIEWVAIYKPKLKTNEEIITL